MERAHAGRRRAARSSTRRAGESGYTRQASRTRAELLVRHRASAGGAVPVRRQLAVGNPIVAGDVAAIEKVDAKVWILHGHANDELVVKIEAPAGGETPAQFEGRHDYVTWLAQQALQGVPNAAPITAGELVVLGGLNHAEAGGLGAPTLAGLINPPGHFVFLKIAKVAMGRHLAGRIADIAADLRAGGRRRLGRGMARQGVLDAILADPVRLDQLGRIAVFDLIVNNGDRFRADGTVNEKNIDFSQANQPIAIDNLDPNNRIDVANPNVWPGQNRVVGAGERSGYAAAVAQDLADKTQYAGDIFALITAIRAGMTNGVATLQGLEAALRLRAAADADAHRQAIGTIIADRIQQLA